MSQIKHCPFHGFGVVDEKWQRELRRETGWLCKECYTRLKELDFDLEKFLGTFTPLAEFRLKQASNAKIDKHWKAALRYAQLAHKSDLKNERIATVLCSILRNIGRSAQGVDVTDAYPDSNSIHLLNTRAAALADVGDCVRAWKVAAKAWALNERRKGSNNYEGKKEYLENLFTGLAAEFRRRGEDPPATQAKLNSKRGE